MIAIFGLLIMGLFSVRACAKTVLLKTAPAVAAPVFSRKSLLVSLGDFLDMVDEKFFFFNDIQSVVIFVEYNTIDCI